MTLRSRPFPLVIAAPSGAGKTSLARALVQRSGGRATFSISATTRPPRTHEQGGRDYHFVPDAEFDALLERGELVEWAEVHGRRYGTPRAAVADALDSGHVVVLDIDVQGARQIRAAFADAVLVFVLPPSAAELHRRLSGRRSEDAAELARRLRTARAELGAAGEFDYVVVNDEFEHAVQTLEEIMAAELSRVARVSTLPDAVTRLQTELDTILSKRSE